MSALLICISPSKVKSQDIHFSQIFETPILRNPSLAGLFTGDARIQSVYRTQWNNITTPYQTTSLSGEVKMKVGNADDYITIGGQILNDKAGSIGLTTTEFFPAINYNKSIGSETNTYISLGFMGGIVQHHFDKSKVTTNNQFDGNAYNRDISNGENFSNTSYSYFDGSVGMSLNSQIGENQDNNLIIGLAYHHFNKSKKTSFYTLNNETITPKWVGSIGVKISNNESSYFTLQSDYSKQGTNNEFIIGGIYTVKLFDMNGDPSYLLHVGSYVRLHDAIIPVAKIEFKSIAIAGSYDATVTELKRNSNGQSGFEVSLSYQIKKKNNSYLDAVRCPRF